LESPSIALPLPVIPQQTDAYHLAPHRIKRCTFRRLIDVEAGAHRVYDVECPVPDRKTPMPRARLPAAPTRSGGPLASDEHWWPSGQEEGEEHASASLGEGGATLVRRRLLPQG